jgi:8-oxo-dGTP pyrophosphatase MutT (NUDIX family)
MALRREDLRRRLQAACPPVDRESLYSGPGVPAAVLVGLLARPEGQQVILTRRQAHLKDHAAEISLPGGRVEPSDAGPEEAALREAFEEIGVLPQQVDLLGCLVPRLTVSDFRVYPFVGWVEPSVEFTIDSREVAEVLEVPLSFVLDSANHRRDSVVLDGERREFYVLIYSGNRIWGATAGILVDLAHALG